MTSPNRLARMISYRVIVLGLLLAAGLLPGSWPPVLAAGPPPQETSPALELEPVTLQLRWFHQFQFAGYYAAQAQGYYRDAGLEVNLAEGDPSLVYDIYEEVLAGRAQYAVGNSELVLERMAGQPLVVLAAIFQHSPQAFIARQSSGLTTPQDLAGRRILMALEPRTAELQATLLREGVSLDSLTLLRPERNYPDYLFDESIDAYAVYESNEPFFLEQAGIPLTYIRPESYGIDFYGDVLFTSEAELAAHPDRARRFREASLRGWQYALDHPDEMIDLILTEHNSPKSRAHLEYEAGRLRQFILPDLVELGHMNPGRWRRIADTYRELGLAEPGYALDGFIYDPDPEPDNSRLYKILAVVGSLLPLAGLAVLGLWEFNRRLHTAVAQRTRELELSQVALERSEERYRAVWDIATDAMALSDPEGIVIDANPAYLELYGYTAPEVIGRSFAIIFPEAQRAWAVEQYQAVFANPAVPPQFESEIHRSDGALCMVETRIGFVESNGRRRFMLSVVRDITERKQAEQALAESEARFRQIVENTQEGFWLRDFPADRIIYVSPAVTRIVGYPADAIMREEARLVDEAILPEYQLPFKTAMQRLRAHGEPLDETVRLRRQNGELAWVSFRSFPVYNARGELVRVVGVVEDVTGRKQAEAELAEQAHFNRAIADTAPTVLYIYDLAEQRNIWTNASYEKILGIQDSDRLTAQEVFERVHPDDVEQLVRQTEWVRNSESADRWEEVELRFRAGHGGWVWLGLRLSAFRRDEAGRVTQMLGAAIDITGRKQAEQALRESEKNLRALIDATDESVQLLEPDGTVIAANEGVARRFGRRRAELVGNNIYDFVDEIVAARRRRYADRVIASGQPVRFVDERSGRVIDNSIYPVLDEAGRVVRLAVYGLDITERVQAERLVRESEAKNRAILQALPDLMFRLTRDGRILDFRASQSQDLVLAPEEVIGSRIADSMPPAVCDLILERIGQTLDTGQMQVFEYDLPVQAGMQTFEARLTVMGEEEALGIVRNITERKAAEENLKTALAEKEILLRELYHRTKNNMQVISSMLMLQIDYVEDEGVKRIFKEMSSRIRTMAMVHEKLYQSQNLSSIDLKEYIADLAALLVQTYDWQANRVAMSLELDSIPVLIDTAIPCGLLLNELISNAFKHAFPNGRTGALNIRLQKMVDEMIMLQVSDNGVGLPPEFEMAHSGRLGMRMIRALAEYQLGGQVTLKSDQQGLTFKVCFHGKRYQARV